MARLNPYLTFGSNCRKAMEFYKTCLGGKLTIMTVGESPMAAQMPPEKRNRVIHSSLENDGVVLMASDMMGDEKLVKGNAITLCVNGASQAETRRYFSKLAKGGKVNQPLKEEFFGMYGDLTDKYGFHWMFQTDKPK